MSTLAKVVPIPKGTYSSSATYNSLDIVRYNGKSWMCKQDSITNITPAEGDYWMMIAQDGSGVNNLTELQDTNISSPSNGQILLYNSTSGKWENSNFSQTSALNDLTDVTISSASNGQALLYNSTSGKWENSNFSQTSDLNDLTDVTISNAETNQVLAYTGSQTGWQNRTLPSYVYSAGVFKKLIAVAGGGTPFSAGSLITIEPFEHIISLTEPSTLPSGVNPGRVLSHSYDRSKSEYLLSLHTSLYDTTTNIWDPTYAITSLASVERFTDNSTYVYYKINGYVTVFTHSSGTSYNTGGVNCEYFLYKGL